jgi:hypothetical protein
MTALQHHWSNVAASENLLPMVDSRQLHRRLSGKISVRLRKIPLATPRVGGIHIDWNLAALLLTTGHRRRNAEEILIPFSFAFCARRDGHVVR